MSGLKKITVKKLNLVVLGNKSNTITREYLLKCLKQRTLQETVVYDIKNGDLFNGEYPNLIIINTINTQKNVSFTVARYSKGTQNIEKRSDFFIKNFGQANYDYVLAGLCSIIDQKIKIKSILSLLKETKYVDNNCQTNDSSMYLIKRDRLKRKKIKRECKPYIIDINNESGTTVLHQTPERRNSVESLKDLGNNLQLLDNEDSNFTDISNISKYSEGTSKIILKNPESILKMIDSCTSVNFQIEPFIEDINVPVKLVLVDGREVMLKTKPVDVFHLATPELIQDLNLDERRSLLLHQAYLDWKYCLERDEDNNMPLHVAVLNCDHDMLKRQCLVLKSRQSSVDILDGENMTALQLAVYSGFTLCIRVLLEQDADVLVRNEDGQTLLHIGAEGEVDSVLVLLDHCRRCARRILQNEELLVPELSSRSDEELATYLINHLCLMCDEQGYTPLMRATMKGNHQVVEKLLQAVPESVNSRMPTCGNTPLYLLVAAAHDDAKKRVNLSEIQPNYKKTIQLLLKYGADPQLANESGVSVITLLSDLSSTSLFEIFAENTLNSNIDKPFNQYILLKTLDGSIVPHHISGRSRTNVASNMNTNDKTVDNDNIRQFGISVEIDKHVNNVNDDTSNGKFSVMNADKSNNSIFETNSVSVKIINKGNVIAHNVDVDRINKIIKLNNKSVDNKIVNINNLRLTNVGKGSRIIKITSNKIVAKTDRQIFSNDKIKIVSNQVSSGLASRVTVPRDGETNMHNEVTGGTDRRIESNAKRKYVSNDDLDVKKKK